MGGIFKALFYTIEICYWCVPEASNIAITNQAEKNSSEGLRTELHLEREKRIALEKELKLQVSLKAETDVAMKLLEKHLREKEETITSLRLQLDQIKQINLEMYRKLQVGTQKIGFFVRIKSIMSHITLICNQKWLSITPIHTFSTFLR